MMKSFNLERLVAAEEDATAAVDAESALLRARVGSVSAAAAAGTTRQASTTRARAIAEPAVAAAAAGGGVGSRSCVRR